MKVNICRCLGEICPKTIKQFSILIHWLISDISNRSCTNCIWHGGKTYSVEENKDSTWFDAKHHCAVQNKSLAVFPREDVSKVTDLLTPVFEGWTNKNAWIGLRLTEYYIQSNNGLYFLHKVEHIIKINMK